MSCETCPLICDLRQTSQDLNDWSRRETLVVGEYEVAAAMARDELDAIVKQNEQTESAKLFENITGLLQEVPVVDDQERLEQLRLIKEAQKPITSDLLCSPLLLRAPSEAQQLSESADFTEKHCPGRVEKARNFITRRTVECQSPGAKTTRKDLNKIKSRYPEISGF